MRRARAQNTRAERDRQGDRRAEEGRTGGEVAVHESGFEGLGFRVGGVMTVAI